MIFLRFWIEKKDLKKMPVFLRAPVAKTYTGVPLGAGPLSPRRGGFFRFFEKMVAGEDTVAGKI